MRIFTAFLLGSVLGAVILYSVMHGGSGAPADNSAAKKPLYWVAPMDPNYRRDQPGKSPMGMDLVPVYEEQADASEVSINPQTVQNLGISSSPAQSGKLQYALTASGSLQYREDGLEHVHSRVAGWVEKLQTRSQGIGVRKGDVLLYLYSLELINAQRDFLSTLHNDASMRKSAHSRLNALGMDDLDIRTLENSRQVQEKVAIRARQAGIISALNVREGMYVMPASEMMTIADDKTLWLIAEVYESQRSQLHNVREARIEIDSLQQSFNAPLDFIYPELENSSRSVRLRFVIPNKNGDAMPGMFARAELNIRADEEHILIPRQSLIRDGKQDRVIRQLAEGRYAVVPVKTGNSDGVNIEILQGINAGDLIVNRGQFLLDSETNLDAALAKLNNQQAETAEPQNVWVKGVFQGMENNRARIEHEAIPEWQWGSMSMLFSLDKNVTHTPLKAGDQIEFCLDKHEDGSFSISRIDIKKPTQATNKVVDHSQHNMQQHETTPMDHSQHNMQQHETAPMDHSQHNMQGH
ncbi:MAG: efflux RND transporter periplasmic adaptor subunit [Oceanospirillaceae bacterium]|nr:efflux RND transporter periplasmic adaptor subunit [Oceanospirillaceae bacterium]